LNPGEFGLFDYKLQITNYKFHQVSGQQRCSKKDLVIVKLGVRGLKLWCCLAPELKTWSHWKPG
jgi:hypothetical protein